VSNASVSALVYSRASPDVVNDSFLQEKNSIAEKRIKNKRFKFGYLLSKLRIDPAIEVVLNFEKVKKLHFDLGGKCF